MATWVGMKSGEWGDNTPDKDGNKNWDLPDGQVPGSGTDVNIGGGGNTPTITFSGIFGNLDNTALVIVDNVNGGLGGLMNVDNTTGSATIGGGGTIKMVGGTITDIYSTTKHNVVTSDNKIIGTGSIQLDFINLAGTLTGTSQDTSVNPNGVTVGGIIVGTYIGADAQAVGLDSGNLSIGNMINNGVLEAADASEFDVGGTIDNRPLDNTHQTGVLHQTASGRFVFNGATVIGGSFIGGALQSVFLQPGHPHANTFVFNSGTLDGSHAGAPVDLEAPVDIAGGLTLDGDIINKLAITMVGGSGTLSVADNSSATLSGGGSVVLADHQSPFTDYTLAGAGPGLSVLTNVDNKILGAGHIYNLHLINQHGGVINNDSGVIDDSKDPSDPSNIDASLAADLFIGRVADTVVENQGIIEQTGPGVIMFNGHNLVGDSKVDTVDNTGGGILEAIGGNIQFANALIIGGTLQSVNGHAFEMTADGGGATWDASSSPGTLIGRIDIDYSSGLTIRGTIDDTASTIALNGLNGGAAQLAIDANGATLQGPGGQVTGSDSFHPGGANQIFGAESSDVLTNVDNLIIGSFTISRLTLDNQSAGEIRATGTDFAINFGTGAGDTLVENSGLIDAAGAAGMSFNTVDVDNTGGTIEINGAAKHIDLRQTTIEGGMLAALAPDSAFNIVDGGSVFDGTASALTIEGKVSLQVQAFVSVGFVTLKGQINNLGTIDLTGSYQTTSDIGIDPLGATILGQGQIRVTGGQQDNDYIGATQGNPLLTTDNTIIGNGGIGHASLGNGHLTLHLLAAGIVDASIGTFDVNTGATITNDGTFKAEGGGTLAVADAVTGSGHALVTTGGTIQFGADFQQNVTFQGAAAGMVQFADAYTGTVSGFAPDDKIDLSFLSWADGDHASFAENGGNTGGTLTILDSGNNTLATLAFAGQYATGRFSVGDDGTGHVQVTGATPHSPTQTDCSGDGHSDVLFIQPGVNFDSDYEWQMSDRSISGQSGVDLFDKAFSVQVTGDFNGDGKADVLLENPTTAGVWEWQLDGTTISGQGAVDVGDTSYHILGTADFNGDGTSDVLWRNDTTGLLYQGQMNGTSDTGAAVGALDPSVWHAVGAGDFTGDGKADILFHYQNAGNAADPANGAFDIWQMDGSSVLATLGVERPDPSWQILGVGDFNGDGISDIAIRNVSNTGDNGAVWVYLMAGTVTTQPDTSKTADILAQGAAGIVDAATWHLQEIGDLNGDGKSDFLFRNDSGYFYSWDMNGTTIGSEGLAGTEAGNWADPSLHVIGQHWDLA